MLKRIEIFDRDGTLTCSMHRTKITEQGLLDLGHWLKNHTPENVAKDKLLPTAEYYKKCVADPEVYTVICTVAMLKQADFDYFENFLGMPDKIIFPKENVKNGGADWKVRVLAMFKNLKQFANLPTFFHEDNMTYLARVCDAHGYTGHYYPSGYGIAGVCNIPKDMK